MARGNFSTSLYASLSRTQVKFGGPTTFGLEIARAEHAYHPGGAHHSGGVSDTEQQSSFKLGRMIERGCFNYRWPVNEYHLDLHEDLAKSLEKHVGTCQIFSFAKDGMFYQILRIEEGGHIEYTNHTNGGGDPQQTLNKSRELPANSQLLLTMGGPLWLRSFENRLDDDILTKLPKVRPSTFSQTERLTVW
jgi:hypothetical protein